MDQVARMVWADRFQASARQMIWFGMKRQDLIRTNETSGCVLIRHGGKHDWYRNPSTGVSQPVPRHPEIKKHLARHIIKVLSSK